MSTGRSNAMEVLPRGSFLTFFRSPDHSTPNLPPPYSRYNENSSWSWLLPCIAKDLSVDEESDDESYLDPCAARERNSNSNINRQGHSTHTRIPKKCEEDRGSNISDALGLIGYTLLILLIVLNVDFLLSTYNPRLGLVNWNAYLTNAKPDVYKMQFCMLEQNREAPTSRVWRYVTSDTRDCATDTMTVYAAASEGWKILSEELITIGPQGETNQPREVVIAGDDLAEEGHPGREDANLQILGV